MAPQKTLFGETRQTVSEAIDLTVTSLEAHGSTHKNWTVAWSGGKDSTCLVTVLSHLLVSGRIARPENLTVLYADTRLELLPLAASAVVLKSRLEHFGIECRTVMAPIDKRFLVYILGRGVPPPNNNTLRWCTRQIKVDPMAVEVKRMAAESESKLLMLTGVRIGESASRDSRIAMACGVNGSECGQGWYQETLPGSACDTLAPILHWRVCNVWEWLRIMAPSARYGGWPTAMLADAYGGDEAEEINARTGCVCCPLASRDTALDAVIAMPEWSYLAPIKRLRSIYEELRLPARRLRKPGGECRQDGTPVANQHRMGPITLESREWALDEILAIQAEINGRAMQLDRPCIDLINTDEEARIRELISDQTWPQRWDGSEPRADEPFEEGLQRSLFS